ncbi:hypothetical protein NQ317_003690 [Molorchus minor]|uniref:Protein kinase domain-containing protein n=1 Tax=Molorchus minor TaxID=1323400 RepID=A0ABQ9K2Z4_9CUCU|nr:hypothetical protein NQ317_003690 [Molorchus minor]
MTSNSVISRVSIHVSGYSCTPLSTVDYVAPEVLSYEPIGLSTDIWSVGVLAYVILSGFSPFGADDKQQTFLNISKCSLSFEPEHFEDVSSAAIDFIKSALIVDPRTKSDKSSIIKLFLPQSYKTTNDPRDARPPVDIPQIEHPPSLTVKSTDSQIAPKSTPITQRKTFSCITDTPKSQRKTYCPDPLNGSYPDSPVRTYTVSANCPLLCPQCGTTCRHITHAPVTKTTITIDRGILC